MAKTISNDARSSSKPNNRQKSKKLVVLQKPNGVIAKRVQKVGPEKFALVCVDPAKKRSEWMMADYYGNLLIPPNTMEHQALAFQNAIDAIHRAIKQHQIQDLIVVVERTGNYHLAPQRAFAGAGWEVRVVHPFAVKQYRLPADPGNKTDPTDLAAQHRAAVAGFGLCEPTLPELYSQLQLRVRHRRDLVEKSTQLACQIREHLHLTMPRFGALFPNLLAHQTAMNIARAAPSPQAVIQLGVKGMDQLLRQQQLRFQRPTLEKILAWANQAVAHLSQAEVSLRHAIWTDLYDAYDQLRTRINRLEREIAGDLASTPYIRLLAIPGINVVSAADFAGEMGPIGHYANANAITGRSGLYPSRYQSDKTDRSGKIVRTANRRLRASLMRIADNLANLNAFFRVRAAEGDQQGIDKRAIRVKIAKNFSRLALACVAGDQPLRHPCCRDANSIIEKLRAFHHAHQTPIDLALADLEKAVSQLPFKTRGMEAEVVATSLEAHNKKRRGPVHVGELLTQVLAALNAQDAPQTQKPNTGRTASD